MKRQINPNIKAHSYPERLFTFFCRSPVCVIPFALAQRNTTRRAVNKPKVAANTRHEVTAATSQFRNDVVTRATKQKIQAPSTNFTTFDRGPQPAALHKRPAAPSGLCSYEFATGADAIVPGDTNTGNFADDGDTVVSAAVRLYQLYGQTFQRGERQLQRARRLRGALNEPGGFASANCLPAPANQVCRLITRSFLSGAITAPTLWARVVHNFASAAAACSPRSRAARPIASSTSNGARCISPITLRQRILSCVCMRTIPTSALTLSSAPSSLVATNCM